MNKIILFIKYKNVIIKAHLTFQNIVESVSVILQPVYASHWQRINGLKGFGADSLLSKMDDYVATLALSQGDTYTIPFEIPTQNISKF